MVEVLLHSYKPWYKYIVCISTLSVRRNSLPNYIGICDIIPSSLRDIFIWYEIRGFLEKIPIFSFPQNFDPQNYDES